MRRTLALFVGAVVAAVGALILGEYEFTGWFGVLYGLLLGMFVGEAIMMVSHARDVAAAVAGAVIAGAGVWWAAWISVGGRHTHASIPHMAWLAIVVGGGAAAFRTSPWRPAVGSRRRP